MTTTLTSARLPWPLARIRTETILVVEPDSAVARVLTRALERAGYQVLVAAYGDEALSRLAQCHELAVLLTEVVLPHMSGAELAQRVSRSFPHVPTIFMSGDMDDTLARYGISECEVEFLRKPFSCGELVGKVLTAPLAWQQVA